MEHIVSLQEYLNFAVAISDFSCATDCKVNFHWGNEKQLNRYLSVDQDQIMGNILMSGVVENQFPLIWLEPGVEITPINRKKTSLRYSPAVIQILNVTNKEWLNPERWDKNIRLLKNIASILTKTIEKDRASIIPPEWFSIGEIADESVRDSGDKSIIIEQCDSVYIKTKSIEINTECLDLSKCPC